MHGNLGSSRGLQTRAGRDPGTRVLAALQALGEGAGTLVRHQQRPWASITFSGTHHTATFVFSGDQARVAGEQFIVRIPEHEFAIPGQIVAEATVRSVEHVLVPELCLTVEVELLLLEES